MASGFTPYRFSNTTMGAVTDLAVAVPDFDLKQDARAVDL
jgi:hypothetical protein